MAWNIQHAEYMRRDRYSNLAPKNTNVLTNWEILHEDIRLETNRTRWQVETASRYSLFQVESFDHVFTY